MSINGLIETSRRSFRALDGAMNTVGQNVANAETEGYTRQRVTLKPINTVSAGLQTRQTSTTFTGAGVSIDTFERIRDSLLQRSGWESRSGLGAAEEEHRVLTALEGLFPEGEGSLTAALNRFWTDWNVLSDAPTSTGARLAVRNSADFLTETFNRLDSDLHAIEDETRTALSAKVDEANSLLSGIAELNTTIRLARSAGTPDFAAEDRRDQAVATLARLMPVRVEMDDAYAVSVGGVTVVEGSTSDRLVFDAGAPPSLTFDNAGLPFRATAEDDGAVGALFRMLQGALPDTRAGLDAIASDLVTTVNAVHTPRYDDTGAALAAGPPFFDPAGTDAATFRLDGAIQSDVEAIAPLGVFTAAGEELAFAMAGLRGTSASGEQAAIDLVSNIGGRVKQAGSRSASQGAVVDHLEAMERGVSGVSIDDELASLIRYQQAFGAAARVLNTAQQMMDTLLAL